MRRLTLMTLCLAGTLAAFTAYASANEGSSEVERLQRQRDQQQQQLRLRMQQQQERAQGPALSPALDMRQRALERDQQQRQQQLHEQQTRDAIKPAPEHANTLQGEVERQRAIHDAAAEFARFERERQLRARRAHPAR